MGACGEGPTSSECNTEHVFIAMVYLAMPTLVAFWLPCAKDCNLKAS